MEAKELSKFADMFAALGSEQRLEIVRLLIRAGNEGMSVGDIQTRLKIPNSTLSHHLDKLRQENLVEVRKDKQWIWHTVNLESIGKLISFLCARCYDATLVEPLMIRIKSECQNKPPKRVEKGELK